MQTIVAAMVKANFGAEAVKSYTIAQLMRATQPIEEWKRKHEPASAGKIH